MTNDQLKSVLTSRKFLQTILALLVLGTVIFLISLYSTSYRKQEARVVEQEVHINQKELRAPYAMVPLTANAAVVYDLATDSLLFSKNPDASLPLASLTKLLTVYSAMNMLGKSSSVVITPSSLMPEGDSGFEVGEMFTFSDIAELTLVGSSNDGAEAIAEASERGGSRTSLELVAGIARSLGLTSTKAGNSTGLDIGTTSAGSYGSARDMAILSSYFLEKSPELSKTTALTRASVQSTAGRVHTLSNTNPDVRHIPGLLLSKTGYTDLAGGNLVIVFDAGISHPIAIVVLGSTKQGRFTDVEKLISATLSHFAGLPAV